MTTVRKSYSGNARKAKVPSGLSSSATSVVADDLTGWPDGTSGPFWGIVDRGLATEEKIKFSSRTGNTLTVATRGGDSTTAIAHDPNASIEHGAVAEDMREATDHMSGNEVDPHSTQLLNNARHDVTARHTPGTVLPVAAPASTSLPSDMGAEGAAATVARSDHRHPREGFGSPAASAVGDASTNGTATSVARSDHKHAREAFGAVTAQTSYGQASSNGAATTVARSDHTHGTPAVDWGEVVDIVASAPGDTASAGALEEAARADHRHAREAALSLAPSKLAVASWTVTGAVDTYTDVPGASFVVTVGTWLVIGKAMQESSVSTYVQGYLQLWNSTDAAELDVNGGSIHDVTNVTLNSIQVLDLMMVTSGSKTVKLRYKRSSASGTQLLNNVKFIVVRVAP